MPIKLGLIGHPVSHSISPVLHNAALSYFGWSGDYVLHDILAADIPDALTRLAQEGYSGINVTVPHKQAVIPHLASLTDEAARCGAVNTIRFVEADDLTTRGHNTDFGGFLYALRQHGMVEYAAGKVCVLGAGGAARAALWVLNSLHCARIDLIARRPEQAETLIAEVSNMPGWETTIRHAEWEKCVEEDYNLLVNCTPLGLSADDAELPAWALMVLIGTRGRDSAAVFDMVYGRSLFAAPAAVNGMLFADGLEMLIGQAALAFEYWTGGQVPLDVMRAAIAKTKQRST